MLYSTLATLRGRCECVISVSFVVCYSCQFVEDSNLVADLWLRCELFGLGIICFQKRENLCV